MNYLLACLFLVLGTVLAQESSERAQELEQSITNQSRLIEQRQQALSEIREQLGTLSAELNQRLAERERVGAELVTIQGERARLLADIDSLREEIATVEAEIAALDAKLADLKIRVRGLLVNLYKQRSSRFAEVLGQAESFHDLRVKNHYLSLLSEQDLSLIEELDTAAASLFALQASNRANLADLNDKEDALRATEASLAAARDELSRLVGELEASYEGQLAVQQVRIEEQVELERTLNALANDLAAEQARLAEEQRRREQAEAAVNERNQNSLSADAAPQALPALASGYVYPLGSPKLARNFGENGSSSVWLQAAEPWAAVYAVQPGVVAEVGLASANVGYIVVIQHEGGLFTAYINLQPVPLVKVGDTVTQNQTIGYLGGGTLIPPDVLEFSTGLFEGGRINYTDPAGLLGF